MLITPIAIFGFLAGEEQGLSWPLFMLIASSVVASAFTAQVLGLQRITLGGIHLFGVWMMLGLAPLMDFHAGLFGQHYTYHHFLPFVPSSTELTLAATSILVWVLCFALGYRIRAPRVSQWISRADIQLSYSSVLVQVLCAIAALIYIFDKVGLGVLTRRGFEQDFDSPGEQTFFASTIRSVALVALLGLLLLLRNKSVAGIRKWSVVLATVLLLIANAVINNPIAAPRFFTGTIFLAFAFALFFYRARTGLSFLAIAIIGGCIAFPLLEAGRSAEDVTSLLDELLVASSNLATSDFIRTFEAIPAALRFLDLNGSTLGYQLLGPLLFWVPRTLWEGKPEGTGSLLAQFFSGYFDNISCPAPCEALVNFGWIGVLLIAFVWGMTFRAIDWASYQIRRNSEGVSIFEITYAILLGQVFFLTRGDFLSPWAFTVGIFLAATPMIVAHMVVHAFSVILRSTSSNDGSSHSAQPS